MDNITKDKYLKLVIEKEVGDIFIKYNIAQDRTKDFLEIVSKIANEITFSVKQIYEKEI